MRIRFSIAGLVVLATAVGVCGQMKSPPETRNAALRYWMAFAEMKDPPSDKATQDLLVRTAAGETAWDEAKLGPILDANADAIAMFQRATRLPDCDWGIEYSQGPRASIAYAPRARVLARLNTIQGMREVAKGQSQAAVDTWLAGIRFTDHLAKGGSLIFALIAESALLPNMHVLTGEVKQGHLNSAQKQQVYAVVSALREDGFDWGRAWQIEAAGSQPFFAELQRSQDPAGTYAKVMGGPAPKSCVPPGAQEVRAYDEYMSDVAAALRLPPPETKARIAELEGKANTICEAIRRMIPLPQHVNDARIEIISAREALLQALQSK
jgi:hypothetical protein